MLVRCPRKLLCFEGIFSNELDNDSRQPSPSIHQGINIAPTWNKASHWTKPNKTKRKNIACQLLWQEHTKWTIEKGTKGKWDKNLSNGCVLSKWNRESWLNHPAAEYHNGISFSEPFSLIWSIWSKKENALRFNLDGICLLEKFPGKTVRANLLETKIFIGNLLIVKEFCRDPCAASAFLIFWFLPSSSSFCLYRLVLPFFILSISFRMDVDWKEEHAHECICDTWIQFHQFFLFMCRCRRTQWTTYERPNNSRSSIFFFKFFFRLFHCFFAQLCFVVKHSEAQRNSFRALQQISVIQSLVLRGCEEEAGGKTTSSVLSMFHLWIAKALAINCFGYERILGVPWHRCWSSSSRFSKLSNLAGTIVFIYFIV